ncbi:MAG: GAF domain-containing protein [Anaerolineae bacterium]|nr:GAF domain-containing protein [Anaerolineae bacterium]
MSDRNTEQLMVMLDQKTAQLAAVREISQAIAEARDLTDTLNLITQRTTEVMHVDSASIYLYERSSNKLVLAASTGLNQAGIGHYSLPFGAGLTGWAAEHRETVAVADAFKDPRFYRILGSGESKFPSLMSMPLISHDNLIGAANVQTRQPHTFTEDEIELFHFITDLTATAIEKAQLVRTALVQEMHHRVKNNLQTIAMLLRLQMGQDKTLSPKDILNESINRVMSIATVHEILSETMVDDVDVLDLIRRVSTTISSNMVSPMADIRISVRGSSVYLPSQRATTLALVANELLQNALEHGIADQDEGKIEITLTHTYEQLRLMVIDNGKGLHPNFNVNTDLGLGLDIVRASVQEDLNGSFYIGPTLKGVGTMVKVVIPMDAI